MKTVLDPNVRVELIQRIQSLSHHHKAQWGRMNLWQMLRHCTLAEEMYLGNKEHPRNFIGRLIGQMAIKGILKDEQPLGKNSPTAPAFKVKETNGDIEVEKSKWISLIESYDNYNNADFNHWFFGKMSHEQVGHFAYKHIDHHLRQFNV